MSNTAASVALNSEFFQKTSSAAGREKIAELGGNYIRDKLREVSFARQILPPKPITPSECQRSTQHDTLTVVVDIEPQSKAMSVTFRGQPTARLIRGARYEIPFFTVSSEKFEKNEQELLAYKMPITKIIEENSVKDMQEIEDRQFLIYVEACVQAYQLEANSNTATAYTSDNVNSASVVTSSVVKGEGALAQATSNFNVQALLKPDIVKLKKLLHRRRLKAERLLITEPDFDDVSNWTIQDVGMTIAGETATDGWKASVLVGLKFIRTIKTDILREGNLYCFVSPDFFGKFFILNQTKFYIDKIANLITWQAWEDIGMGIGNVAGVVKLELYSGSVTPTATTTGYAAALPVSEYALGAKNNRVDEGVTSPHVVTF